MASLAAERSIFIGRDDELARLNEFQQAVISGLGKTVMVSGEAGLGKTRLLEEFVFTAEEMGVRVLKGAASAEAGQPFMAFSQALDNVVEEPLFEEHEFKSFAKIFVVNKGGMLVAESSSGQDDMDADIFAGMLSAVQDFVRDSFDHTGAQTAGLGRLEYGDLKILIEHGPHIFLTAVFDGSEHGDMKGLLKATIQRMEEEHGPALDSWTGNMEEIAGLQTEVDLLTRARFFVKKDLEGVRLDNERVRISDKVLATLRELTAERPLLIVLEDLHWADESSLFVLKYLARNIHHDNVFLLGTFRPGESDLLQGAMDSMVGEGTVYEVPLSKLGGGSVSDLADEMYPGHEFPQDMFDNLASRCDGNPLFVKEMLWQMGNEGSIVREGEGYRLVNEDFSIPGKVQDIIANRLANLEAGAMALAEYVSCAGMEFDDAIATSYQMGRDIPASLASLVDHGIILSKDGLMQFSHAVYHDYIYSSIGSRWKSSYHKSLGEYYEDAFRTNPGEVVYELARHFSRSNEHSKSLEYCIRAGEKAESSYAVEQAKEYYQLALGSLSRVAHDRQDEADLLARLGDADTFLAAFDDAVENLEKAYKASGNKEFVAKTLNKIAWIHLRRGDEEHAAELLDQALEIATGSDVKLQVAKAHHHYGILYIKTGDYPKAREHFEASLDLVKDDEPTEFLSQVYHSLGMLFSRIGDVEKAIEFYQQGVDIAEKIDDKVKVANSLGNIGIMQWYAGDMDKALEYFLKTLEIRKSINDKSGTGISYDNIAGVYGVKGDLDKSLEYYERGIEIFRQTGEKVYLSNLLSNASLYYLAKEDLDKALASADESLALMHMTNNKRGECLALINLVNINVKRGDAPKSLEQAELAQNIATELNLSREFGLVHTALGVAHGALGNWDRSNEEFERAVELFGEFEDKLSEASMYYEYGLVLTDARNPGRDEGKARDLLEKALGIFTESGMNYWVDRCKETLEGL